MTNLRTTIILFTALVITAGAITGAMTAVVNAAPYGQKRQDHQGWTFGPISSIQNDQDGKPAWILSGHWATNVINKTKESFNQTNPAKFDVWIDMVMLNASAMEKHRISNFSLTDANTQDTTSTYKGTVTVTMKDGSVADVPVEIKVMDNHAVSISLDGAKTNNHFGNTPIYGTIMNKQDMASMMGMKSREGNMTKSGKTTDAETLVRHAYQLAEGNVMDVQGFVDLFADDGEINLGNMTFRGDQLGSPVVSLGKMAPDIHRELHRVVVQDNIVAVELTIRGTFTGPFESPAGVLQPNGAKLDVPGVDFWTVEDGKIKQFNCYTDMNTLFEQMGVQKDFASAIKAQAVAG